MLAVDESTTIKNPGAARTKNIIKIADGAVYRRILTGSPVTKSPLDLFSQCYFLDPFLLNYFSYVSFRNRYAIMRRVLINGRSIQLVAGYQRIEELEKNIKPFSFRVLKEDCLDLPKKLFIKHRVELTKEQRQLYDQMRTTALAELNSKVMSTSTVLTQLMRLHQITCGHMKTDNDEVIELKNNRIKDLLNLIEEVDGKVIIWANYVHDIKNIIKAISHMKDEEGNLKYGTDAIVTYYGAINADQRQENIKKFQDPNSKVRFFIGNPQTGGYGITLTEAKAVIYYSNSYDLEKRLQSEDRAHRIGQKNKVTYIDMMADDTVDEKIVESLRNKVNIATEIMGEDLREWI
jgi:SNF2 family DNA or RNA helicase